MNLPQAVLPRALKQLSDLITAIGGTERKRERDWSGMMPYFIDNSSV
jgi:hypothetical protein